MSHNKLNELDYLRLDIKRKKYELSMAIGASQGYENKGKEEISKLNQDIENLKVYKRKLKQSGMKYNSKKDKSGFVSW